MNESDALQCKLEEYKQLCDYHRHDDQMKWTILGLGYTAAGALLGLSVFRSSAPSIPAAGAAIVALALVLGVTHIYRDINCDTLVRLGRLHELEGQIGITNHRLFEPPALSGEHPKWGVNTTIRALAFVFVFVVLAVSAESIYSTLT